MSFTLPLKLLFAQKTDDGVPVFRRMLVVVEVKTLGS